jgi:hypothetical protein
MVRAAAVVALLCLGFTDSAPADEPAPSDARPFEFGIDASGFWGPINGYIQIPAGGNPGSTSMRRPTLHELGIDDAGFWDVNLHARYGAFVAFGGYTGLELDSSGTLAEPLVSHDVPFPAGSPFNHSTSLNTGYVGAGWRFEFAGARLQLMPKIDIAILDFSYRLESPGLLAARAFSDVAVRLGADGSWALGHGFAVELSGEGSLPIGQMPQIASVTGRLSYALFPSSPVRAKVYLGMGGRWIDFEDGQTVPNHIHVSSGPLVTGGFSIAF